MDVVDGGDDIGLVMGDHTPISDEELIALASGEGDSDILSDAQVHGFITKMNLTHEQYTIDIIRSAYTAKRFAKRSGAYTYGDPVPPGTNIDAFLRSEKGKHGKTTYNTTVRFNCHLHLFKEYIANHQGKWPKKNDPTKLPGAKSNLFKWHANSKKHGKQRSNGQQLLALATIPERT
jgi:hypothetical protein